jgi:hypothetical protein
LLLHLLLLHLLMLHLLLLNVLLLHVLLLHLLLLLSLRHVLHAGRLHNNSRCSCRCRCSISLYSSVVCNCMLLLLHTSCYCCCRTGSGSLSLQLRVLLRMHAGSMLRGGSSCCCLLQLRMCCLLLHVGCHSSSVGCFQLGYLLCRLVCCYLSIHDSLLMAVDGCGVAERNRCLRSRRGSWLLLLLLLQA